MWISLGNDFGLMTQAADQLVERLRSRMPKAAAAKS